MANPVVRKSDLDLAVSRVRRSGATDYALLSNKPSINGHTLIGNKTGAELGLANSSDAITAITFNGSSVPVSNNTAAITGVSDVTVDGTSVVSSGVGNIPRAGDGIWGVVKVQRVYDSQTGDDKLGIASTSGSYWYVPLIDALTNKISNTYLRYADATIYGIVRVDDNVNSISTNPVRNNVIKAYVDGEIQDLKDYVDSLVYIIAQDTYADESAEGQYHRNEQITTTITLPLIPGWTVKEIKDVSLDNSNFEVVSANVTETSSNVVVTVVSKCISDGGVSIQALGIYYTLVYERKQPLEAVDISFDDSTMQTIQQSDNVQDALDQLDGALYVTSNRVPPYSHARPDGSYVLTATKSNSTITYDWASGSGGGGVSDVTVNGSSVVSNNVAVITVPDEAQLISYDDTNNNVLQGQDVQSVIDGIDWLLNTMSLPVNPSQNGKYFHTVTKATGSITYGWTTLDASDIPVDDTNFTVISAQDVQTAIEDLDDNIDHLWNDIAQAIETVKINGTALVKTNKAVNIDLSCYLLTSDEITEAQIDAMFV